MDASSTSSSDIDEEEADRLRSVAVDYASVAGDAALLRQKKYKKEKACSDDQDASKALKFYQARALDSLHKYLDETFEILPVEDRRFHIPEDAENSGFHLFKNSSSGLTEKEQCREAAISSSRRLPHADEASEMFQSHLLAAAIDGVAVKQHAENSKAKALALWVLHQAEESKAKKREDERVARLKLQRGEQWLPSVARDMQTDVVSNCQSLMNVTGTCTQSHAKINFPCMRTPYSNGNVSLEKAPLDKLRKQKQRFKASAVT